MFNGLVEEVGVVQHVVAHNLCKTLKIQANKAIDGLKLGDSISVNGVCLTVIAFDAVSFTVEAIPETLRLTNISELQKGVLVNLERAAKVGDRMGGHLVQGHVDGVVTIMELVPEGGAINAFFSKPKNWSDCLIPKGFVALDGMSLTITEVNELTFGISFIPHTQSATIVQYYQVGQKINIEIDHIAKAISTILSLRNENLYGQN